MRGGRRDEIPTVATWGVGEGHLLAQGREKRPKGVGNQKSVPDVKLAFARPNGNVKKAVRCMSLEFTWEFKSQT